MLLDLVAQGDIQELEIRKCSTLIIHLLFANNILIIFKLKQTNKQIILKKKNSPKNIKKHLTTFVTFKGG